MLTSSLNVCCFASSMLCLCVQALSKLSSSQAECALTVVTPGHTLDLVASSRTQRDDWLLWLRQFVRT